MLGLNQANRDRIFNMALVVSMALVPAHAAGQFGGGRLQNQDHIVAMAFSNQGSMLAAVVHDKIAIWELTRNRLVQSFVNDEARVFDTAFSHDDKLLAAACEDGRIRVWNIETGELSTVLAVDKTDRYRRVAFAPDGKHLASISSNHRHVSGEEYTEVVRLWEMERGKVIRTLTEGDDASLASFAFSPDGQKLAMGLARETKGRQISSIRLWNLADDRSDWTVTDWDGSLFWLAYSPDGKTLATSGIRTPTGSERVVLGKLSVWDLATRKSVWCIEDASIEAKDITFSADGSRITTYGSGKSGGEIVIRDAASARITTLVRLPNADRIVFTYSPDGTLLATSDGRDKRVELRHSATGLIRATLFPFRSEN